MPTTKSQSWSYISTNECSVQAAQDLENQVLDWDLPFEWALRLNLIIEELFLNTVKYGAPEGQHCAVIMELKQIGSQLQFIYQDKGIAFNPFEHTPKNDLNDTIGGRGILLVEGMADVTSYNRQNGWNIISLNFTLVNSYD